MVQAGRRDPGAPNWLTPLAAVTLAAGRQPRHRRGACGRRSCAGADQEWLRTQAQFRLRQLDAMDQIDALERVVALYEQRAGRAAADVEDLVRAGYLQRVPSIRTATRIVLECRTGRRDTSTRLRPLNPLPVASRPHR